MAWSASARRSAGITSGSLVMARPTLTPTLSSTPSTAIGDVEGRGHPARHGGGAVLVDALAQDDELVPAEMGGGVRGPDDGLDATGRLHQDLVPDGVAQPVVDPLEPVDVAEEDAQGLGLTAVPRQRLLQTGRRAGTGWGAR